MKKTKSTLLFIILSAAAYYLITFIAIGKGGSHVYSITALPIVALGVSMLLGVLGGFRPLYILLTGLVTIPLPIILFNVSFTKSFLFGVVMAVIALVGMLLGTIIYTIVNKSCGVTSRDKRKAHNDKPIGKSRSQAFRSEKPIDFSEEHTAEDFEKKFLDDEEETIREIEEEKNESPEKPEYVEYTNEELLRRMRGGSMNKPVSPSLSKDRDSKFDTQRLSADFQTWFNLPVRKDIKEWATFDGPSITEKAASDDTGNGQEY